MQITITMNDGKIFGEFKLPTEVENETTGRYFSRMIAAALEDRDFYQCDKCGDWHDGVTMLEGEDEQNYCDRCAAMMTAPAAQE